MPKAQPYAVFSREEVLLLLELAREHQEHVRISYCEKKDRLEILLEADSPELARYFGFMLTRNRRYREDRKGPCESP